jgi:hypothetical protein
MNKIGIDATVFLGLHSDNDAQRIAAKNFFVKNLSNELYVTYEQVAICDTVIWTFSHALQSQYYPFMDYVHTVLPFKRIAYSRRTFELLPVESKLGFTDVLTCASAREHQYMLYTWNEHILQCPVVRSGDISMYNYGHELPFPDPIEQLYNQSLAVRICLEKVWKSLAT